MEEKPSCGWAETMTASPAGLGDPPTCNGMAVNLEPVGDDYANALHPNGIKCEGDTDSDSKVLHCFSAQVKQERMFENVGIVEKEENIDNSLVVMRGEDFVVTVDPDYLEADEEMVSDVPSASVTESQSTISGSASDFLPSSGGDAQDIRIKCENVDTGVITESRIGDTCYIGTSDQFEHVKSESCEMEEVRTATQIDHSSCSKSSACPENRSSFQSQEGSSPLLAIWAGGQLCLLQPLSKVDLSSQNREKSLKEKKVKEDLPRGSDTGKPICTDEFSSYLAVDRTVECLLSRDAAVKLGPPHPLNMGVTAAKTNLPCEGEASKVSAAFQLHSGLSGEKWPGTDLPEGNSAAQPSFSGQAGKSLASDETGLNCPECGQQWPNKQMLLCHIRAAHQGQGKSPSCPSIRSCLLKSFEEKSSPTVPMSSRLKALEPCSYSQLNTGLSGGKSLESQLLAGHITRKPHSPDELSKDLASGEKAGDTEKRGLLKCPECGMEFSGTFALLCHIDMHRKHKKDQDCTCGKSHLFQSCIKRPADLRKHQCSYCPKKFASISAVCRHVQTVHKPERMFRCTVCGKTSIRRSGIVRHVKEIHWSHFRKSTFAEHGTDGSGVGNHMGTLHTEVEKDQSTQCETDSSHKSSDETGTIEIEKLYKYRCPECGRSFIQKGMFELHIKIMHKTEVPTSNESKTGSKGRILAHSERPGVTAGRNDGSKEECIPVKSEYDLIQIIDVDTGCNSERNYKCAECGGKFSQRGALDVHVMMVHKGRRYSACSE